MSRLLVQHRPALPISSRRVPHPGVAHRPWRRILAAVAALLACLAVTPAGATAQTTSCSGIDGDGFFDPPSSGAEQAPGTIISCRSAGMRFAFDAPQNSAWQIVYASRDRSGEPMAVSGTVIVPTAPWAGSGRRPVIALAPGTQGLANRCGFSRQLVASPVLEAGQIVKFLRAGFAVVATDYQGYLNGQTPTYIVGRPEGTALLDAARAAVDLTPTGITAANPVGLFGYSQGGQGSLWAAELARSYAPDVNVVAAAAGGVPGDLLVTARFLNGGLAAGFLFSAVVGLHEAYPELPYDELITTEGEQAVRTILDQCFIDTLLGNVGKRIEQYTVGGIGIDELLTKAGPDGTTWQDALADSTLGRGISRASIPFPVAMYRGVVDEIIPTTTQDATYHAYCDAGIHVTGRVVFGNHILALFLGEQPVTDFFRHTFAGRPPARTC